MKQEYPHQISDKGVAFRCPFYQIKHYQVLSETGKKEYYVTHYGKRTGIVLVEDNRVLLTRQFRFLSGTKVWELPGGKVDENETPEEAAIRECAEETGILCSQLIPLLTYEMSLETVHNPTTLFLSRSYTIEPSRYVSGESIEFSWFDKKVIAKMIREGLIIDSFSLLGLLTGFLQTPLLHPQKNE